MTIKVSDANLSVRRFVILNDGSFEWTGITCRLPFKQYLQTDGPDVKPARGHLVIVSNHLVNWLFIKELTGEDGFVHASEETK